MAITITRGLTSLVSVFNQQSIEFTVPNGTAGVAVTVGGYSFTPVRTSTVTVDTYVMDLTDILRYVLGFPNDAIFADFNAYASASCTVTISATGETSATTTGALCFGFDEIGDEIINGVIPLNGASAPQYHHGQICFYSTVAGSKVCSVGGVDYSYTLEVGYNDIVLHATQNTLSGTFTVATTDISFPIVYVAAQGTDYLKWIDKEGRYHKQYFRLLATDIQVESSNIVPTYYQTHPLTKQKSVEISKARAKRYTLDIIAKDETHFAQLTDIRSSFFVQHNGNRVKVISSDTVTANCRQNLHFTITLEQEQYVPTY